MSWRYSSLKIAKFFMRSFTVSWRFLDLCLILLSSGGWAMTAEGHFVIWGDSPVYPSSASTRSLPSKAFNREWRKIVMSFHAPHGKGPLIHTMSPVAIVVANSYLRPDFLANLWDEYFRPYCWVLKSAVSIFRWVSWSGFFFLSLNLDSICKK